MILASRLLVVAALALAGACNSSPTDPRVFGTEGLRATLAPPELVLTNESKQTIRFIAMDAGFAAKASWCLCKGSRFVPPGGEVTIPFSAIAGYEPGASTHFLIYWGTETSPDQETIHHEQIKVVSANL